MQPSAITVSKLPHLVKPDKPPQDPLPPTEDLLLDPLVDPITAQYRLAYAREIMSLYPKVNEETALVLGQMAANRARYGVTYPNPYHKFLDNLDQQILSS